MHQSGKLTCDQEGAAACPCLIGYVTGVLAIALSVQCLDEVTGVVTVLAELPHGEEAGPQLPLVAQEAGRVGAQQAAGKAEGASQSLTHLRVYGLHHRGVWQGGHMISLKYWFKTEDMLNIMKRGVSS